ncbi:glycosyltransferase [Roseomonas sp. E05]|uniref:glycosyltransferase n=1 Tax=Roseomonas sp. E05 TaxID=3046310 RepID=UPI0024B90D2D|nr:glycosyltransferase [Roseomonas sp. E05]MDJ0390005.1 glycosyltransferase [Roseomonas sp. E05]
MIPKRLHYVWVGGRLPDRYAGFIEGWRRLHPTWEVMAWNESNIDFSHPLIAEALRNCKWAKVADIARMVAVHKYGGIYLDTDFELLKPLDPLTEEACFVALQGETQASDLVANGVFGAEPGHWFVAETLRTLLSMRTIPFGLERPTRYGPKLVTRLLWRHGLRENTVGGTRLKDILVLPAPVFFPYPFEGTFTPDSIVAETLAIHHWEKSWGGTLPAPLRLARKVKRHLDALIRPRHA